MQLDETYAPTSNLKQHEGVGWETSGMFEPGSERAWPRQRRLTAASLTLHGLLLGWLLHAPVPQLLTPTSVALGWNGRALGRIYFPVEAADNSSSNSASIATEVYRHQ